MGQKGAHQEEDSSGSAAMLKLTLISRQELRAEHHYCCSRRNGGRSSTCLPPEHCVASAQYEVLGDNLSAMLNQEKSCYQSSDYLRHVMTGKETSSRNGGKAHGSKMIVDEYCRDQIVLWSYRVVDYFNIDREVVAIAMSYLDRFMSIEHCNRRTFKLAATTTLQLAVKIHHPHSLKLVSILSDLSRGEFDAADITAMESAISNTLKWRLHPPTSLDFVSTVLMLDPPTCLKSPHIDNSADAVLDFALFFAELSVCDYFFVTQRQSVVALASVLNAMEGLGFLPSSYRAYVRELSAALQTRHDCQEVVETRERLWTLYERSEECSKNNAASATSAEDGNFAAEKSRSISSNEDKLLNSSNVSSPVCISQTQSVTIDGYRHGARA